MKSTLEHGLVAGGTKAKDGRQTVFFSPLNPLEQDGEEAKHQDNLAIPRKFHCCSKWRHHQDAVFWIKLVEVQNLGLQFGQTKSNAVIVYQTLPN